MSLSRRRLVPLALLATVAVAFLVAPRGALAQKKGVAELSADLIPSHLIESCYRGVPDAVDFAAWQVSNSIASIASYLTAADRERGRTRAAIIIDSLKAKGSCAALDASVLSSRRTYRDSALRAAQRTARFAPPLGLSWGMTLPQVRASGIEILVADSTESAGLITTALTEVEANGLKGSVLMVFDKLDGLTTVHMSFQLGIADDCEKMVERFRNSIAQRYPNVEPKKSRTNATVSLGLCEAIAIGEGQLLYAWVDKPGGYSIAVAFGQNRKLQVGYRSPESELSETLQRWVRDRRIF